MKLSQYAKGYIFLMGVLILSPGLAAEGQSTEQSEAQKNIQASSPSASSSMYKNVEGRLKEIQGDVYILESSQAEEPIRVQVGQDTAFPNGHKEPGQSVSALVSAQDGHALIIR